MSADLKRFDGTSFVEAGGVGEPPILKFRGENFGRVDSEGLLGESSSESGFKVSGNVGAAVSDDGKFDCFLWYEGYLRLSVGWSPFQGLELDQGRVFVDFGSGFVDEDNNTFDENVLLEG